MSDKATTRVKGKRSTSRKKGATARRTRAEALAASRSPATGPAKEKGTRSRARRKVVLIIDEDAASVAEARSHLEIEGYEVVGVGDPLQGLKLAKEGKADLVLVDVALAEMDGFQVCKSLTTDHRTLHVPVVFMSQRTEPADRLLGFLAGGSDYITKPFTRETIVQGVNKLLRR